MAVAEWVKYCRHLSKSSARRARRFEKRRAARLRRQAERKNPETAPARCLKGWAD